MCTVTFLPLPESNGFILTSNRDEQAVREKAAPPKKYNLENSKVVFPKDLKAGGTWIAAAEPGITLCLLNGGLKPHIPDTPYRKSRGLVVLDFFKFLSVDRFVNEYDLENIEPFTLIFVDSREWLAVNELIWDGSTAKLNAVNSSEARVWSSVTLYEKSVIEERKRWFQKWLVKHPVPAQDSIIDFHTTGGSGDKRNDLLMNRDNRLHTVSIPSVIRSEAEFTMKYHDLYDSSKYQISID